jgi:site-specific DNA-methyltransferase (adenine-specific)
VAIPIKKNTLFYGDNLVILREYIADESIDLIYLDPPFNSKRTYNVLFRDEGGEDSQAQIVAFDDTWHWDASAEEAYRELITDAPVDVSTLISALRDFIGTNQMMAYLVMMAIRLVELHRVLKPTGSLYLHCDPTASHYLKIILDTIFGSGNFKNEIIWSYKRYTAASNRFQRLHDVILYYGKSANTTFNDIREEYGKKSGKADSHYKQDEEGKWYRWQKRKGQKPYKVYLSEGRRLGDVWEISIINASAKERLGYPTQKPLTLLERIVKVSSSSGDTVLDPFCGCGTTIAAAEKLNRKWIGIDITHLAISLQKYRLQESFPETKFEVIGEPKTTQAAEYLAKQDRFQFEWWALSLVKARPGKAAKGSRRGKKGADKGIDGVISFIDGAKRKAQRVLVQVKSGKVSSRDIRDLVGTVEREKGAIGVLVTLRRPSKPMKTEAVTAGYYESPLWGKKYPKIQILTIEELFGGKQVEMPPAWGTFRRAERVEKEAVVQDRLL